MWTVNMTPVSRPSGLFGSLRAFAADRSGNMIMLFALAAPAVLGLAALGTEGGALYEKKAAVQAAADQAAVSAVNSFNSSATAYTIEAKAVAASMGFVDGQNGVTVTVNNPPASGSLKGKSGSVEVIISLPQPPMLSRLFHTSDYIIDGRAVATYGGPACVLALDPTAKNALTSGGSTIVNMPKCNLVSDSSASSSLSVSGSASVTVNAAIAVGGINATSGLVDNYNISGAATVPNPYAGLSVPAPSITNWGSKLSDSGAATVTLNPGWYNNGLHITANQVATLTPGVYYIDGAGGNFQIDSGAVVTGAGVTFVLTSSTGKSSSYPTVSINGSSSVNITAPITNSALGTDSSGVVIFEDPKASGNLNINGTSNTYFGGAIVAPSMAINFSGTGVSGTGHNCTQIIGDTVTFIGNSSVSSDCSSQGTAAISGASKTVLSE
jgi:putative Flp pilus-assembly TadE/G-like protein